MNIKKLQKIIDKGIVVLSDHDDKKHEERYINLQNIILEAQDYIEKGNYSVEVTQELYEEIKRCIKEFEEDRIIFIIFLIILCGLLFVGIFYITYSHFYEHVYNGGSVIPVDTNTTTTTTDFDSTDKTQSTTVAPETPSEKTSTTIKTSSESSTTTTTTKVPIQDSDSGLVTVIFDNSNLIDLENLYPVLDSVGMTSNPTTWKLSSTLSKGSRDYMVRYAINFIDNIADIDASKLLDISNLKFQLIVKHKNTVRYNSGVQELDDYPLVEYEFGKFYRPIITLEENGNIFYNDETIDFELRMWLDSSTPNSEQGKKYRFNIFVEAEYEFME